MDNVTSLGIPIEKRGAKRGRDCCVYLNIYKLIICMYLISHSFRTYSFKSSDPTNVGNIVSLLT